MGLLSVLTLKRLRTSKFRNFLSVLSIAFGVALATSIELVNESTLLGFRSSIESISGNASFSVLGGPSGFPESILERLESIPGVESAVPVIETQGYFSPDSSAETATLMILGVDLLRESSVRAYAIRGNGVVEDPLSFLNQPDSIILTRTLASSLGLGVGDPFQISTAKGKRRFVIRGLLDPEGPAKAYGGNLAILDLDAARVQFGKEGKLDRVDLVIRKNTSLKDALRTIEQALPRGLTVESPASQADSMRKLIEGYQGILSFVGFLALIVGMFLVMNSTSIALAERRRELGILRAIGAERRTLLRHLLEEGFVIGLAGSITGVLLGRMIASGMTGTISQAISHQYLIPVFTDRIEFTSSRALRGIFSGTLTALLATWFAARKGLDIPPLEAVRGKASENETPGRAGPIGGVLLLGFIALDAVTGLSGDFAFFRFLNLLCLVFGSALASPFLVRMLIFLSGKLIPSTTLRLSCENLLRNSKRTSTNLMTLMTGLLLVMVLSILNGSIKHSVLAWFHNTLSADLVVSSTGKILSFKVQPLREQLKDELNRLEGVDVQDGIGATGLRYVKQVYEGRTLAIKAFDPPHPRLRNSLIEIKAGGTPDEVRSVFFSSAAPVALVSENFVRHFRKRTGDVLELNTPSGPCSFKIIGVVSEFTNPEGVIYLNRDVYKKIYQDDLVSGFFLMAKPGTAPVELRSRLDAGPGRQFGLMAMLNSELNRDAEKIVDESFAYTVAIEYSALLVGLFGLFNTLFVSILERRREFGVLRAIGMGKFQLGRMILTESLLQGTFGGMTAIGVSVFACYFWIMGTVSNLLGWVLDFSLPLPAVGKTLLLGIAVGVLAGLVPSFQAARAPIRESLES